MSRVNLLSGNYDVDYEFLNRYKKKNGRHIAELFDAFCKTHGKYISEDNSIAFYDEDGELHREDGPALIKTNGDKEYYFYGMKHREDGPAVIKENNEEEYWEYDVRIK